jgi:GT2 family glycosyltransferase
MEPLTFSIIVPTYQRPGPLANCLGAVAGLDYPRQRFEVIVVDDGGDPPAELIAARWRAQLPLTLLRVPHAGAAAARNAGVARAQGRFLAFIDDDCMPASDWLRCLDARLACAPGTAIGGQTLNALPNNPYSTASQLLISYLYAHYNTRAGGTPLFASNNLAVPRDLFRAIGGFNPIFKEAAGEDREFCDRWTRAGYQMTLAPEAHVYHARSMTLRSFWHQHFNYGRGAFYFHDQRARHSNEHFSVEPPQFYLNMFRYPFSEVPGRRAFALAVLLFLSQAANAVGFLHTKLAHRGRAAQRSSPSPRAAAEDRGNE